MTTKRKVPSAALCLALLCLCAQAQPVVVKAGRILDVRSGQYRTQQTILIDNGRIVAVGELTAKLPAGARVIDLGNRTVLPGLIDCHTHLTFSPQPVGRRGCTCPCRGRRCWGRATPASRWRRASPRCATWAPIGYADVALRDAIIAGDVPGPRMLVSGPPLSITGGHGDQNFLAPEIQSSWRRRGGRGGAA